MKAKKILFATFVGIVLLGILYWFLFVFSFNLGVCLAVIQQARNPITGEKRVFPSPCNVPIGWEKQEFGE